LNLHNGKKITLLAGLIISAAVVSACSSPTSREITPASPPVVEENEAVQELPKTKTLIEESPLGSNELESVESEPASGAAENPDLPTDQEQSQFGNVETEPLSGLQPTPTLDPSFAVEPTIGAVAPNFILQTTDGDEVRLHDLRGEAVMVNYWVTWCIPCIEEMPVLEKLHREYQDQGFTLLSVNGIAQDDLDTVMDTVTNFDLTFPVVLDEGDTVYNDFKVRFMPTSFFIDPQGVIKHIQLGSTTEEGFRTRIEEILSEQL
jgi:peroxiredoxin